MGFKVRCEGWPMAVTRREIQAALTGRPTEELWASMLAQGHTLQPFWQKATTLFAERTCLPADKRDFHFAVIDDAFRKMDDWRMGRVKYVKARRGEIDSAISFIRNKALERSVASLRVAPAVRNAAG